MQPANLIPTPDTIPAPVWLFQVLGILTFTLHILAMNIVLGGTLIILYNRLFKKSRSSAGQLDAPIVANLPIAFAWTINLGVAPLLFVQVIYGTLIYTSSVLMAVYWILVIPLLILAYYGAYIHAKNHSKSPGLASIAIAVTSLILLYIAFTYVNNFTLMLQPSRWLSHLNNAKGTILNVSDPTFLPRYLHFIVAAIAVGGLFLATVWWFRARKNVPDADLKVKKGLLIFGIATALQLVIGFWFLLALPREFILAFMGGNTFYTVTLMFGILMSIGAIISALIGKVVPTLAHLIITVAAMSITRDNLRSLYLDNFFQPSSLQMVPQYSVLALFLFIFVIGLAVVFYMLKIAYQTSERRAA